MNCETFLDHYFLYDRDSSLPLGVKFHLARCERCRNIIAKMQAAEGLQREVLEHPFDAGNRLLQATMTAVYQHARPHQSITAAQEKEATLLPWLTAGVLLIIGFILLPLSDSGKLWLTQFGDSFCIPFALLCALSITCYAAVFFAKNLVFFSEKFMLSDGIISRHSKPLAGSCI